MLEKCQHYLSGPIYCHSYNRWKVLLAMPNNWTHIGTEWYINTHITSPCIVRILIRLKLHSFWFHLGCQSKLEVGVAWKGGHLFDLLKLMCTCTMLCTTGQTKFWRYSGDSKYWGNNWKWSTSVKRARFNILPVIWIIFAIVYIHHSLLEMVAPAHIHLPTVCIHLLLEM